MKLKSFGCSFIFGTDLADDGRFGPIATPSHCTYPVLIAEKMGLAWSCHARPGSGNFEILNKIIGEIATNEPAIFVINWTWVDRFSYLNSRMATPRHPYNPMGWASILPVDENTIAECYYKNLHTQLRDKIETLTCIKTAIDCLRSCDAKFIMTWTDHLIWETEWHCPASVAWLQQQVQPYLTDFEGSNFVDWSRKNGFVISDTMHPLEDAHQAAADLILQNWDRYIRS